MTNLEALRANISDAHGVVLTEDHFVKALLDEGMLVDAAYVLANQRAVDFATIRLYNHILGGAGIGEGSLSYNFQLSGVVAAKKALEAKWQITSIDTKNQVDVARPW